VTGLGRLVRFVLRRDRIRLLVWSLGLTGLVVPSAASLPPVYPDQASIDRYVALFGDNPALVAFAGPGYGFDHPNLGVILVNEVQLYACLAVALMGVFLVVRHTRAEEDDERAELVRANVVGRHAHTAAPLVVVSALQVVLGLLFAASFVALDYPVAGSFALAGSIAAVGLVFTAVGAVVAQLAGTSRTALALGTATLGVAFGLRALGDIGDNGLRWLSPIGWAQGVRAYAGERWWALGLCAVGAGALTVLAFRLSTAREPGSGILANRPGPARAAPSLLRPLGLAVRLHRGTLLGWAAGLFVTGALYGSIAGDVEEMIADNPVYADVLAQAAGASLVDSFFATSVLTL
jgi:ABC-2 type transport system permease protein